MCGIALLFFCLFVWMFFKWSNADMESEANEMKAEYWKRKYMNK